MKVVLILFLLGAIFGTVTGIVELRYVSNLYNDHTCFGAPLYTESGISGHCIKKDLQSYRLTCDTDNEWKYQIYRYNDMCGGIPDITLNGKSYFCTECCELIDQIGLLKLVKWLVSSGMDDFDKKEEEKIKVVSCAQKILTNLGQEKKGGFMTAVFGQKKTFPFSFKAKRTRVYKTANAIVQLLVGRGKIVDARDHKLDNDFGSNNLEEKFSKMKINVRESDIDSYEEDNLRYYMRTIDVAEDKHGNVDSYETNDEVNVNKKKAMIGWKKDGFLGQPSFLEFQMPTPVPPRFTGFESDEESILRNLPMSDDEDKEIERLTFGDDSDGDSDGDNDDYVVNILDPLGQEYFYQYAFFF